jgi:alkanesulfonate monooxygenase SsuD/methylene tetrahydromethanopterin reductase-like flavin-dependent oxidoreductase (luciferase family)
VFDLKVGFDIYPMQVTWPQVRDVAIRADALGYDSLWTWDHLYGIDDPDHGILEAWSILAAWSPITQHATLGLLVGANTFRHPAVVAKAAVTVDHISGGRLILGLGAGWRRREHSDHGIDFGTSPGQRLRWLGESVEAIAALLRGESVWSPAGARYGFAGARHNPLPLRGAGGVSILIGGGGERRTLPIVARYADLWHHRGSVEALARKRDILAEHCIAAGRDPSSIELCFGPYAIIRDDPKVARRVLDETLAGTGERYDGDPDGAWLGPPEDIAERWRPFAEAGFRHLIASLAPPFDPETVERLHEARTLLRGSEA